jgi:hypothetical protein
MLSTVALHTLQTTKPAVTSVDITALGKIKIRAWGADTGTNQVWAPSAVLVGYNWK